MRVLVTGASGFLGSWIARELAARGHSLRLLLREGSPPDNLEGLDAERVRGDVLDDASVRAALLGCDAVVHAAGVVHFLPTGLDRLFDVNVRGVEVVLGEALAAGVRRAVLTSSTAAAGGRAGPEPLDERSPSNAEALGIHYLASKLRGEQAGLALAARGLPLVVARPSFVLGPGDVHRSSAGLVLAVARRAYPAFVRGGVSFCDVRDVARGHAEALERGRAGEVYVLGGHDLELEEFMRRTAAFAGVPPPRRLPYPVAWPFVAGSEAWAWLRGRNPKQTRQLLRSARLYSFASSAKAEAELGYSRRPFDDMLRDTLTWFLRKGWLEARTPELRRLLEG